MMYLERLSLKHYRNYESLMVDFESGINILMGENAQGKTNLLESIYMLSVARSHRAAQEKECIAFGAKEACIHAQVCSSSRAFNVACQLTVQGKKFSINGLEQEKISDYLGVLPSVLFTPEDVLLVKGAPQLRRRFLNIALGQMYPKYIHTLKAYQHLLKQRNAYLKEAYRQKTFDDLYFSVLSEQFSALAGELIWYHLAFISQIQEKLYRIQDHLSLTQDHVTIAYQTCVDLSEAGHVLDCQEAFLQQLKQQYQREKDQQRSLLGPHRDDLQFLLNDQPLQYFGSQGQQRTVVLALKLAEREVMQAHLKDYPILLLDDVFSELDEHRQEQLVDYVLSQGQTFITTNTGTKLPKQLDQQCIFNVSRGTIEKKGCNQL